MATHPEIPRHVAIIMDGNGRWAKQRGLPRLEGHRAGAESVREVMEASIELGVEYLTLYAFSSENWNRPVEEVTGLMELMVGSLGREVPKLRDDGVQLHFIGERGGLSEKMVAGLLHAEASTAHNTLLVLNVCFNYGGRWDIARAAARLAERGEALTESNLDGAMALAHVPDPDLFIRTGGEQRLSNFLLWQSAYSELFFSDKLWPEFDEAALDEAIGTFQGRERRFGKTSAQLNAGQPDRQTA